jgi:hypothetical protein
VTLQALDKLTKPFQGMIKTSRTLSSRIGKTQKQLADLKAVQRNNSGYRASKSWLSCFLRRSCGQRPC